MSVDRQSSAIWSGPACRRRRWRVNVLTCYYASMMMGAMARAFDVIPAIDLRGGRIVRLEQGDFDRATVFEDEPAAAAAAFAGAGARWLHVVDLDGARAGEPRHLDSLRAIVAGAGSGTLVEAAGGLRSPDAVAVVLAAGAARIVFGTAAIRNPALVRDTVDERGSESVVVAVDVRAGQAIGDAWNAGAEGRPAADLIQALADAGVTWFEVTAIDRDGLLGGPDLGLLEGLVGLHRGHVIASGGVRSLADVHATRDVGCAGAIVGRALYDGSFDLAAAIASVDRPA